jgi:phosphatidylglycerol:prolipoprotein diacylglycerol transferase
MYPVLFKWGGLTVYTYGSILTLGLLTGGILVLIGTKKKGISIERVIELFFCGILSFIFGSRALYVLANASLFWEDPLRIVKIWEGGMSFYGGMVLATGVSFGYARWYNLPVWKLADLFSPSFALGLFFARTGCFFAGCCYGKETILPWGITFTNPMSLARLNVSLHPTQLYEAGGCFGLFLFLIWMDKRKTFNGQIFWLFSLLYSVIRFFIEMLRGDPRGFLFGSLLSISQAIAVFSIIVSLFMMSYLSRREREYEI